MCKEYDIFSIDLGYGFTKAVRLKKNYSRKLLFPSVILKRIQGNDLSKFFGNQDDYIVDIKEKNNTINSFYVGDSALINNAPRTWNNDKKIEKDLAKILIGTSIYSLLDDEEKEITIDSLALGLPISLIDYSDELVEMLNNLKIEINLNNKGYKKIKINTINVFVQGLGAYNYYIYNEQGEIRNIKQSIQNIGLIEIGYRTVEILLFVLGKKGITLLESGTSTLEDIAISEAQTDLIRMIHEEEGIVLKLNDIEKAVLWHDGMLLTDGGRKEINIQKYQNKVYEIQAEKIKNEVNIRWKDYAYNLKSIVITGGGGKDLFKYLSKFYSQLELQENSQYANAYGYAIAMLRQDKTKQSNISI